jgi:signal transduction histidine kinase
MMKNASLAARLFVAAALWSAVVLAIAGFVLASIYRSSLEQNFDERLGIYLKALVAELVRHDEDWSTLALGEPRFDLPLSGWYWQIATPDGKPVRVSRSLFDRSLPLLIASDPDKDQAPTREAYVDGPDGGELRQVERVIDLGDEGRFVVAVAADAGSIADDVQSFDTTILIAFLLLGVGLVAAATLQIAYGLRPLGRISRDIAAIRAGRAERISQAAPREIAPLAREINDLLESNKGIVERARTGVGNLAHGLKTPLSVIANEAAAASGPFAEKVREQVEIMRQQIDHHLRRARIAAGVPAVVGVTEVGPVVEALARTMEKIHGERCLTLNLRLTPARFRGERQDLEEMVGNLVDNACKWANEQVSIEVAAAAGETDRRPAFSIVVDDDGPGLPAAEREAVAQRGKRLDETKPGSGVGLAIVSDLAALYGGTQTLAVAPAGGLRTALSLPAA